ncbi:hypothetical protein J1N35_035998 [Gossypium stocksii]|uniref:Transmembrane protein n=1 Tax=Gossypium stocksii TaxID=47602 RepID=A0A9D3UV61_9ROSI|nr:hypothetical protein J1N35_035998 [Gossypium stocksii]
MEARSYNAPPHGIMLALSFLFWLFIQVDIAKALSIKLLPILFFIIFIIFALCFLSSHKPLRSPYVVRDDNVRSYRGDFPVNDVESYLSDFSVDDDDIESYLSDFPVDVDDVESYPSDFSVDDDDVESYLSNFPVDVDDVESVPSLSAEEMESCNSEIIEDKHIILVEDDIGDMDAFSLNNSDDDWEQIYPSNIDPNYNWQFL